MAEIIKFPIKLTQENLQLQILDIITSSADGISFDHLAAKLKINSQKAKTLALRMVLSKLIDQSLITLEENKYKSAKIVAFRTSK